MAESNGDLNKTEIITPKSSISLSQRNIPLFIAFRVLFNARWYYPVLAILFLDFGLTLEQYALLNVAWAICIVCLEVPSGALADRIGRRRMVVLAAALMVVEMALFAFAPVGSVWLFPILLLNRLLSGAAEACASGADESLAYDSLREEGREAEWPSVLARLIRWQSFGFFVAMLTGAAVYDHELMQRVLIFLGSDVRVPHETTLRWPLYLTLANAVAVLFVTLRMRDPGIQMSHETQAAQGTWKQIINAGRWILHTPLVLFIILAGMCLDSVIRLFLTVGSNYYRLIELPEGSFGIISSASAVLGMFTPKLALMMLGKRSMAANFVSAALFAFAGLCGAAFFYPVWGVLVMIPFGISMSLVQIFLSHYLNQLVTDSSLRATVLSFKGLSFNLAYGGMGLLFAGFSRVRHGSGSQDAIFIEAIRWLPWFFVVMIAALAVTSLKLLSVHRKQEH